jgi:hypothetical protein
MKCRVSILVFDIQALQSEVDFLKEENETRIRLLHNTVDWRILIHDSHQETVD